MNLEAFIARLRAAASTLSPVQLATLAGAFVTVVALVVGSAYWVNAPTYAVLFTDLDPESANGVVARLKTEKVAYLLDEGGRTIRVPASRVDELRLEVASQGMPASGRIGFEIFDRTAFGITDFLEHVNYRRALEGELARTIGTIAEVSSARVHIAMTKPSLFASQEQPAKASVVLKLRNNRPLAPPTIAAISGLVSAAVEGLRPEAVVIIDNFGRPLARPPEPGDDAGNGLQLDRQQRIERELSARVVSLLEPIVGPEHVRVNVSAKLSAGSQEETEERWDPTPIVRSRQSVAQGAGQTSGAQGIAGTRGNLPDTTAKASPQPVAGSGPAPPPVNTSEITNYEVSKLTRHRIEPHGQVARLSVAVLLDDARDEASAASGHPAKAKPRAAEELQKIRDVVSAAVGFDTERGDQLTVENIAFEEPPVQVEVPKPWWKTAMPTAQGSPALLDGGRIVAVLFVAVLVVFGVVRPALKRTLGPPPAPLTASSQLPQTIQQMEGAIEAELEAETEATKASARRLPVLTKRVAQMTNSEPEHAARLIRTWLVEGER